MVTAFAGLRHAQRPVNRWQRSVRETWGLSGKQVARHLGVLSPPITALEKVGWLSVIIRTMRQAAAFDGVFVMLLSRVIPFTGNWNPLRK
jgi:hypothetical protein